MTARIQQAIKTLDHEALSLLIGKVPNGQLVEMLLCEIQKAKEVLCGFPYYDYDHQEWIED